MKRIWILAGCIIFSCGVMRSNLAFAQVQIPKRIPLEKRLIRAPDLIIHPVTKPACGDAQDPYCNVAGGELLILVKNQGFFAALAPASTTKVRWHTDKTEVLLATPSIPSGGFIVLTTPLKNYWFTITVDSQNQVAESNETNNSVDACCINCPVFPEGP